jgi:4-carboxymuconolactone decarboxylase
MASSGAAWGPTRRRSSPPKGVVRADREERLRRLALQDEAFVESVLAMRLDNSRASGLDPKTHALVRLGALVALGAAPVSFQCTIDAALAAGASDDEIVGALIAVAPVVGFAKVISATPKIAMSMGYDIDAALEALNGDPH